jgi:ribokinase
MPDWSPEIVVIGSHAPGIFVRVQRVPLAGETVIGWDLQEPEDGGKGSNQAIAAARLGAKVSFVGCLGNDHLGAEGERLLRLEDIDLRFLQHSSASGTGAGIIILDQQGVPAMVTYRGANEELNCEQVEASLNGLKEARVMLTQFEILPDVAVHAAKVARRFHMTTIVNPAPASPINLTDLEYADILVPNEGEAKILLGVDPEAKIDLALIAERLLDLTNAGAVIITAGEQGIIGADKSGIWQTLPPKVRVVDTSGAGDVFCAALAVGIIRDKDYRAAATWACSAAALSVTKEGTIPSFPTTRELEEFLSN